MKWLGELIARVTPRRERELFLRELDELHARRAERRGRLRADAWYVGQCLGFVVGWIGDGASQWREGTAGLGRDIAFSTRALLRRPGFLVSTILTLGIGTGSVALVYTAAHWVLLREVPGVGAPEEMTWVRLESADDGWSGITWGISDRDARRLGEMLPSLTAFSASAEFPVHVRTAGAESAQRLSAALVTPEYFETLGMRPVIGRFFSPSDHQVPGGPLEVVVGFDVWRRNWQSSVAVLGADMEINGRPFTVIGVTPDGFRGSELPGSNDIWIASSAAEIVRGIEGEGALAGQLWNRLIGRRRPGATSAQVALEANAAMKAIRQERAGSAHSFLPSHFLFRTYDGIGLDPWVRSDVQRTLMILFGASGFLLLLAVANVANLSLTRAASRRSQVAIRVALGAGAWRVAREPLVEGVLIGAAGSALALGLVSAGGWAFSEAQLTARGASIEGMSIDATVFLVTLAVAVFAGFLASVGPALATRRERALDSLRAGRHGARTTTRLRSALVVAQVALSGTLLIGAGLFVRTVVNLDRLDLGVSPSAFTFSVAPGLNGYDDRTSLGRLAEVERRVADAVGGEAIGLVFPMPLNGWRISSVAKRPGAADDDFVHGSAYWTDGRGLTDALGMRLIAGRGYVQDLLQTEPVNHPVMINEAMARALFPDLDPSDAVGRPLLLNQDAFESTVTGVLHDARLAGQRSEAWPTMFIPFDVDWADGAATFYVSTNLPEATMTARVRQAVAEVDPRLPIYDVGTIAGAVAVLFAEQRIVARLAAALGAIGLLLVAIGLYGVLSYVVHERTREIGVRVALGASSNRIRDGVVARGLALTGIGVLLGLPLAWATTRLIESRLFGVGRLDIVSYAGGLTLLVLVALVASWVPARRATRVSPLDALRES